MLFIAGVDGRWMPVNTQNEQESTKQNELNTPLSFRFFGRACSLV